MNSFVRSTLRVFVQAASPQAEDISSWQALQSLAEQGHSTGQSKYQDVFAKYSKVQKAGKLVHKAGDLLHEDVIKYTLLVDADFVMSIVAEIYLRRLQSMDKELMAVFVQGDVNGDGVLSFNEFRNIVQQVNGKTTDRQVLRMFREALLQGEDKDTIGPQAFVNVCKAHDLTNMVSLPLHLLALTNGTDGVQLDLHELEETSLSALCRSTRQAPKQPVGEQEEYDEEEFEPIKLTAEVAVQTIAPEPVPVAVPTKKALATAMKAKVRAERVDEEEEVEEELHVPQPAPAAPLDMNPLHIRSKPMTVNVVKSKQVNEQIQQALQQRKLMRMQER